MTDFSQACGKAAAVLEYECKRLYIDALLKDPLYLGSEHAKHKHTFYNFPSDETIPLHVAITVDWMMVDVLFNSFEPLMLCCEHLITVERNAEDNCTKQQGQIHVQHTTTMGKMAWVWTNLPETCAGIKRNR